MSYNYYFVKDFIISNKILFHYYRLRFNNNPIAVDLLTSRSYCGNSFSLTKKNKKKIN